MFERWKERKTNRIVEQMIQDINSDQDKMTNSCIFRSFSCLPMQSTYYLVQKNDSGGYDFISFNFTHSGIVPEPEKILMTRKTETDLREFLTKLYKISHKWEKYYYRRVYDGGGWTLKMWNDDYNFSNAYPSNISSFYELLDFNFNSKDAIEYYDFKIEVNRPDVVFVKVFM